jgi:hypothetical protein
VEFAAGRTSQIYMQDYEMNAYKAENCVLVETATSFGRMPQ